MRRQVSLLVPFRAGKDHHRREDWEWLKAYWEVQLPEAEIVVGHDPESEHHWWRPNPRPFSKTIAVNNAFHRSHGDIIAIMDADAYLDPSVITHCARRIRTALEFGIHLWFVPYTHLYRLTLEATEEVLESDPADPLRFSSPPPPIDVENTDASGAHQYGALCQIMPREAFIEVRGMDERMAGWGSDDVCLMRALDTLWGKHRKTPNDILHLWHHKLSIRPSEGPFWEVRIWEGQTNSQVNSHLASQYHRANGNKEKMRALVEGR